MGSVNKKKCILCEQPIEEGEEYTQRHFARQVVYEMTGNPQFKIFSKVDRVNQGYAHTKCIERLDIPTRRRLFSEDFTDKILSIENEVWCKLDESGNIIPSTIWSDIPEIDSEIQILKKKKKLSDLDRQRLKELIN